MLFGSSFLPSTGWSLVDANIINDNLEITAGGFATITLTEINGSNLLPEGLLVVINADDFGDVYLPEAYAQVTITYVDDSTFNALVPINGEPSILLPTIGNYEINISAFKALTFKLFSSRDITLTTWALCKSLNDALLDDVLYYGFKISSETGLSITRSDNLARAIFNADNLTMQVGDGEGTWQNKLYYGYDVDTGRAELIFDGKLSADVIEALSAVITPNLYTSKGNIAELTVDHLNTSNKAVRFLNDDTSDDNFIEIYDQNIEFKTANFIGYDAPNVHLEDRQGNKLYWTDATKTVATTDVTPYKVYSFPYNEYTKLKIDFREDFASPNYIPMLEMGTGGGTGPDSDKNPDRMKGFIYKDTNSLVLRYMKADESWVVLRLGENGLQGNGPQLKSISLYNNGMYTTFEDGETYDWSFTKDGSGRITKIKNNTTDNEVAVNWNSGNK